jgi:hypothetical protein
VSIFANELTKIPDKTKKDVFAIRTQLGYHGGFRIDAEVYLTEEMFDSALRAANKARSLKKTFVKSVNIKKHETPKKMTKLATTPRLYTEAEMASHSKLKFKETWAIMSKDGLYVHSYLKNNKVAEYSSNRAKAEIFKTYEEALFRLRTLDMISPKRHVLKRFMVENIDPSSC